MADLREYPRNKEGSNISKVVVDRDLCIAAVSCMAVAAGTWELDSENKIVARDANADDDEMLLESAKACPTKAILVFDKEGNQIWPV